MDNNQSKKTAGAIALIIIAVIVITVIIIAIATNKNSNGDPDVTDKIENNAESDLSEAVTDMVDDASEALDDVGDALDPDKDTDKESADGESSSESNTDTVPPADTAASVPTDFCLPVTGYISKEYSMDTPVFSLTMNDYRTHSGIDIQAAIGTEVAAFAEGTVTEIYNDPFMGFCVEITHSGGMVSKYMNLSEELAENIKIGTTVACGQTIAKVGNTASMEAADESHLHFEVMLNDASVDPMEYIDSEVIADIGYEN